MIIVFIWMELSAPAATISSRSTRRGSIASTEGLWTAVTPARRAPTAKRITNAKPGWLRFRRSAFSSSTTAVTNIADCVKRTTSRRSAQSAMAPPMKAKATSGTSSTAPIAPTTRDECVS